MVSALDSGSSGPGSSSGRGQCVGFMVKTPYSHSAFLHPGILMGTNKLMLRVTLRWTSMHLGACRTLQVDSSAFMPSGLMSHLAGMQTKFTLSFYKILIIDFGHAVV